MKKIFSLIMFLSVYLFSYTQTFTERINVSGTSLNGTGSQINISAFNGNGIRINGSGGINTQDAITYQSASNGAGAAIAFGRQGSSDTYMSFYTNSCCTWTSGEIAERMRLNENGYLGIGIINPQSRLHVNGSANFTGATALGTNSVGYSNNFGMYYADRGNLWTEVTVHNQSSGAMLYANPQSSQYSGMWGTIYSSSSAGLLSNPYYPLVLGAGREAMRITPSGNVGIGQLNPTKKLEISTTSETVSDAPTVRLNGYTSDNFNGSTTGAIGVLDFYNSYSNGAGVAAQIVVGRGQDGYGSGQMRFRTSESGAAPVDRMTISKEGNVGIGPISNPWNRLQVVGQSLFSRDGEGECCSGGNYSIAIAEKTNSEPNGNGKKASISFHNAGFDEGAIELSHDAGFRSIKFYDHQNYGLGIDVRGNGAFSGKVAVGAADFTRLTNYALAVNGSIVAKKVQVTQNSPWPDYVFHPTYNLRSLSSLEAFINENNHLPDVPSAEEVEKDGVDLGSTQAALLKKIEELTLYVIEQDKKIKKLETTVSGFKK